MLRTMNAMTGQEFEQMRQAEGLTQEAVGRQAGVTARQVRNWEMKESFTPQQEARARRALEMAARAASADLDFLCLSSPEPTPLSEMSNLRLIALLHEVGAVLAQRLDNPTPRDEDAPDFGHSPSQIGEAEAGERNVNRPPNKGTITGRLGMPPATE